MTIKSPEQIEDAAITDAINTAVSLVMRDTKRQLVNYLQSTMKPEIDEARLRGKQVDIPKFAERALKAARVAYQNYRA